MADMVMPETVTPETVTPETVTSEAGPTGTVTSEAGPTGTVTSEAGPTGTVTSEAGPTGTGPTGSGTAETVPGAGPGVGPVRMTDDRVGRVCIDVACARLDGPVAALVYEALWPVAASRLPDEITLRLVDVRHVDWEAVATVTAVGHRLSSFGHRLLVVVADEAVAARFAAAAACGALVVDDRLRTEVWIG
jgi:hypothetical protein